jgi:acyl-CoA reductase-like NAD-dependent aldehyde dehydrogenase
VTDPRVAFFSFIGSARVGWYLRSILTPGTRCALDHGGAAPAIIDKSADLDRIIEPLVKGGYYHAGQVCVSVQRVYVHADIERTFLDRFAARVATLKVGDPLLPETEVGPLILPREADRVKAWIEEAAAGGAEIIGGGRFSETPLLPAIIFHPPAGSRVATQEVFGPVTCVSTFTRLEDAIATANALPMAFQSSIFTEDLHAALMPLSVWTRRPCASTITRPFARTDALRRPSPIRLRHRRHSSHDARNDAKKMIVFRKESQS